MSEATWTLYRKIASSNHPTPSNTAFNNFHVIVNGNRRLHLAVFEGRMVDNHDRKNIAHFWPELAQEIFDACIMAAKES